MSDSDATLIGNLTVDPELRFTATGTATAKFGVAVNRRWGQGENRKEETSFFNIVCWGTLAENVSATLAKGMRVVVYGRLAQRTWEKDDGQKINIVEVNADAVGPDLRWATAEVSKVERDASTPNKPGAPVTEEASNESGWGEAPF